MKIAFKDVLNKSIEMVRKYFDNEAVIKMRQSYMFQHNIDLSLNIVIDKYQISVVMVSELYDIDSYYNYSSVIEGKLFYINNKKDAIEYLYPCSKDIPKSKSDHYLTKITVNYNEKTREASLCMYYDKAVRVYLKKIDSMFTDNEVQDLIKTLHVRRSIDILSNNEIKEIEYMDGNGNIDTDLIDKISEGK